MLLIQKWLPNIMDYLLVFHLIVGIISSGQIQKVMSEPISNSQNCYTICPIGHYKHGPCNSAAGNHSCEKCGDGTYTEIENIREECFRCTPCPLSEKEKEPCVYYSNRKCECQNGYYRKDSECVKCDYCNDSVDPECECEPCMRKTCLNNPECKKKCEASLNQLSTTVTTTPTTAKSSKGTKGDNLVLWLLAVVAAVLVVVVWLLLLFTKNMLWKEDCCLSWSANKNLPVEDQKCKGKEEQHSHQGSSPTTLTINLCEEPPMMPLNQCPASRAHLTFTSHLLPDIDHTASRHEELSDHWPAVVLYTIIKAVPLRRWKEFLRLLSVADHEMERVELDASSALGFMEKQYQMLRLWSQRSSAGIGEVFSALRYMELPGCAQLLQESLEKLPWRSELKQGLLACRGPTDCGLSGTMQDTLVSGP